ncbi:MAG: NAD(P)/FAD-dependent oxidoreductase [Phycisphaerales bacterium]|nr:NAD(P)/FAD-dependent oxidoreductase [Phycisphaerales bacterium]
MTDVTTDILIVGAGPAGLAAARAASSSPHRPRITIVDENQGPGGQIWRRSVPRWAADLVERAPSLNMELLSETTVAYRAADGYLVATRGHEHPAPVRLRAGSIILATGARELFLPFPGWTLPNVMGAGGLQAMAKSGLAVAGKRIVIAGSGPLLLAVADYLHRHGAEIPAIIEQAPAAAIRRFGMSLIRHPSKLVQGALLKASLRSIAYWTDSWILRANAGRGSAVKSVLVHRGERFSRGPVELECEYVACGFGLVPNTHLAAALGCRVSEGRVVVDELQRTSDATIYAVGESVGIGGVETAVAEGAVAGFAAAGAKTAAIRARSGVVSARRFAARLEETFALRAEVLGLAEEDTIFCRCEDVSCSAVREHGTWREAKLQTRCGMGPCQGRVCGAIARHVLGFDPVDPRPPVYPVPVTVLAGDQA